MNKVIDNSFRIESSRSSVEEMLSLLELPFEEQDDYSLYDDSMGDDEAKPRKKGNSEESYIKTRRNAFVRAKKELARLQLLEGDAGIRDNLSWYTNVLNRLVKASGVTIDYLYDVVRKDIDISKPQDDINKAIELKEMASDVLDDVLSSSIEFQRALEKADNNALPAISTSDFKVGLAEDHAYDGFYKPVKGKYKPGYNKDLDAVVISYDGTVGDIITVYGLRIALPKKPKKVDIANHRKVKKNQYWERPELPSGLTPETVHMFYGVIEQEFYRRDNGYWFYNNGTPTYITGAHYMLLTYYKTDAEGSGFFHYRKAHRDLFYYLEAMWVDQRSLGIILGKARRTGATYVAGAFMLTKAISTTNDIYGLTSKKDSDAKKVFKKIQHMFKHMPFFFKPLNTGENLGKELLFHTPSVRTTKSNQKKLRQYKDLNTEIGFQATDEDSYDSLKVKLYIGDELSKWKKGNILVHWGKVKKTLLTGSIIRGKAILLSTVEYYTGKDPFEDDAKSGDRFKHLYYASDLNKRDEFGQTPSGLYKIFISSLDNYEGFIDKYGNCVSRTPPAPVEGVDGNLISVGVYEYLHAKWSKIKSADELNDERRRDPIEEGDMFRIASNDSLFNVLNIQDQIDYNEKKYLETGKRDYIVGNFFFTGPDRRHVEFQESSDGRFMVKWLPSQESGLRNAYHERNGRIYPANSILGCIGIDPYKVSKTKYGGGSKGAIVGYLGEHPVDGVPKNDFFLVYCGRPQVIDIFFEDVMACLFFYGIPALIENNVDELLKTMYRRGFTRYALRRPDTDSLTYDEERYGGIPGSNMSLLMTQASLLARHIEYFCGYADEHNIYRKAGEIGNCSFNNLLSDFLRFDIKDRTKYDLTVAASLAVYGSYKFMIKHNSRKSSGGLSVNDFYNLQTV